ncbi:CAP domain-containing protein [Virgibacillus sediminis]|uniref:CAP domain-containing protein n=1 Tax=Virgibacillus sediminis TaxID=202260 RepID=A0ABV7A425_9BACI
MRILMIAFIALFTFLTSASPMLANVTATFVDVGEDNSHHEGIEELAEIGIIQGYPLPDGKFEFKPYAKISRTHVAVMLSEALNLPPPDNLEKSLQNFQDIDTYHPYAEQIGSTYEANIFQGNNGIFNEGPITREQMATVLVNAYELEDNGSQAPIYLGNVSPSHQYNVAILAQYGITNQLDNFRPGEYLTRGQFATFLYKTINTERAAEPQPPYPGLPTPPDGDMAMMMEITDLVNEKRTEEGLAPLTPDTDMDNLALIKAKDMADNDYFDHVSPTLGTPFDLLTAGGIEYTSAGENIAAGRTIAEEVMERWMNSPGHRQNIMNPAYTHIGVGVYHGGNYGSYQVQLFTKQR